MTIDNTTPNPTAEMFARQDEHRAAAYVEGKQAEQWPDDINASLVKLAAAVVDLRERVDTLEAKVGTAQG